MAKAKTVYVCSQCGAQQPKWQGQCPDCQSWNTLTEQTVTVVAPAKKSGGGAMQWAGGASGGRALRLTEVQQGQRVNRMLSGIGELDRVLGGGLVEGSVNLLAGEPGIGKSTLLLQAAAAFSQHDAFLYVTGEESLNQVADRAVRLTLDASQIHGVAESHLEDILEHMEQINPRIVVIDSIQTLYSHTLNSAPGTVSQIRACTAALVRFAKQRACAVFLVGHVTKENEVAGPKVLEHMVDGVFTFEGDPQSVYRLVRAIKNRFGAANELGAFEMTEEGLISVDNPSAMFLSADRQAANGSCVFVLQDGPRPLLIEIQALLDECMGNVPRRLALGVDANRMSMMLAILHKHAGLTVGDLDVFINAVGGIRALETAADLPMFLAMISSLLNRAMPADVACFGEIGLTGEIRPVQRASERLKEAQKLGFTRAIVPKRGLPKKLPEGIHLLPVGSIAEALEAAKDVFLPGPAPNAKVGPRGGK